MNFNKTRIIHSALFLVSILLSACGGGGGGGAATNPTIISGVASKGPLNGSTICAYAIAAGAKGAALGSCATNIVNGNYSIDIGAYTGPVLFEATGGTYTDEATGTSVALASPLRSMLSNATGSSTSVAVTALTELAYQIATAAGGLSSANIHAAITSVQTSFSVADIINTNPVDALNVPSGASAGQKTYALALATISQYQKNQPAGTSVAESLQTIQACLAASASCGTGATSVGVSLNVALYTFQTEHTAFSGTPSPALIFGDQPIGNYPDFPVNELYAAVLISKGIPEDIARFFAAVKLTSNCASATTCTYLYTYPNGATREVTMTATQNQQYTPTDAELTSTASVTNPVYDGKFAATGITGIEDSPPTANTQVDISYFVPTTSIPVGKATMSPALSLAAKGLRRAPGVNDGFTLNLTESGVKGADVAIGSILEHYEGLGKSVKATGSVFTLASALSDVAGAAIIAKEINANLKELDDLEKCAADPTNSLTKTDPNYTANAVAKIKSTRAELKEISAVRFINIMGETGTGIGAASIPVVAVLSIPLKQAHSYTEQTLKNISESLMQDARSSVVSCKPTCPTSLTATGVSESQIDLSWSGSIGDNVVTGYIVSGGNANSASTAATVFSDTGLTKSTTYCYTVSAYNDYGTAENCPQACGQTMGPPVVHGTTPYAGQTNVPVNTSVTATFSEAMDATTITGSTFTLEGGAVAGAVSYSGNTATFTPSSDLDPGKKYTATITTGVTDTDGIAMEESFTWSFTTVAAPPAGNLQFTISLGEGAITAIGTADVTWTKFEDLGDVRRYAPSGTITADITLAGLACDTLHVTVPIKATAPSNQGGALVVYTAINAAFAYSYSFSVVADQETLAFSCTYSNGQKFTLEAPAPIIIGVGICEAIDFPKFTNEAQLAGSYSCLATGLVNVTWDFSK